MTSNLGSYRVMPHHVEKAQDDHFTQGRPPILASSYSNSRYSSTGIHKSAKPSHHNSHPQMHRTAAFSPSKAPKPGGLGFRAAMLEQLAAKARRAASWMSSPKPLRCSSSRPEYLSRCRTVKFQLENVCCFCSLCLCSGWSLERRTPTSQDRKFCRSKCLQAYFALL